jgi:DNA-binding NarL/FixJ family response regulator
VIRVLVCDDQALIRAGFVTVFGLQPDLDVVILAYETGLVTAP